MIHPAPIASTDMAEPCVNCEQDAAVNWLLCLECATRVDEAMLIELEQKYSRLDSWLKQAEAMLNRMSRNDPRFNQGHQAWERRLRVYERIADMGRVVKAAS